MCGFAGYLDPATERDADALRMLADELGAPLARRGPDGAGTFVDPGCGLALVHRRLAVVDLSPSGAQPMESASGRCVLVVNGEIYDHRRWRTELEALGVRFRGTSDTEVLLEGIERWGLDRTLERVDGMFALALWDRRERRMSLARDRFGEKPLYYARLGRSLVFGSRLSVLRRVPGFRPELDAAAVASFLRFGYVPHPRTIWEGVAQLPPGGIVEVGADGTVRERSWWRLAQVLTPPGERRPGDLDDLADRLRTSVVLRLQADVPTGVFLSGGIDSSLVTALAQQSTSTPVRTFTVAVGGGLLDESARAARIARHLGTEHTTIELGPADARATIDEALDAYDEPFADPSAIPTLLLCREVRRHVTVALGGDGGDELFAGYNRHVFGTPAWRTAGRVPAPLRSGGAAVLQRVPTARAAKLARLLRADRALGPWAALAPVWPDPLPWIRGPRPADPVAPADLRAPLDEMRWLDTAVGLPDDMLVKVDRASMHWALEVRTPFLTPDVAAWAWAQPEGSLVRGRTGKLPLRQLLARWLPADVVEGAKRGFDPPLASWLRGPLRSWAAERLSKESLAATGWLDPEPVTRAWEQHLRGRANHDYRLWTVLSFVCFLERRR